ncbi:MAG: hypothetical protein KatS3mg055_2795 [Chloroflexus sp.]|uniref:hypothetical protein n=1 Tax=Chloroflexus sp. TaxID=1904827 RepID=UPI0021DEC6AC|nr:hypothetical protein [Chloroflexus sp.]GIV90277.1 MAG: hypothetical protein KatS3mg055_2795 [Chloroflexus sp.]
MGARLIIGGSGAVQWQGENAKRLQAPHAPNPTPPTGQRDDRRCEGPEYIGTTSYHRMQMVYGMKALAPPHPFR